ncbi:MAG: polyprenyl synthetase family protein [Polyangiaceae bacterium]|nr:polyprenyl synthetase family protein [Polyangiaceae bacterium]
METRLAEIRSFLSDDLSAVERDLDGIQLGSTPMHESARHLLTLGGKRIRPMCVALASRIGGGFCQAARELAVASELVHNATLLHDDVVDMGDRRRGAPTSRILYGNAASIFAGDWLLVDALMRVRRAGMSDVLDRALGVLAEMLEAEALQLERRGRADVTLDQYMQVVRGKTASLFRWAMFAGGRAGELDEASCARLERFGEAMGVAFQVVDDALDAEGETDVIGKEALVDLREGKVTYPLMVALERDAELRSLLAEHLQSGAATLDDATAARAAQSIRASGGATEARALAQRLVDGAIEEISNLPDKPATHVLVAVAHAVVNRRN